MLLNIQYTILKVNTILPNLWFCVLTIPVAGHKLWTECKDAPPSRLGGLAYDVRSVNKLAGIQNRPGCGGINGIQW